jgi:hypothetical protein
MSETIECLAEAIAGAWNAPFRGGIEEYAGKLDLQSGYAVKGRLDMNTVRHLIEPLQALRSPDVQLESVTKAVQTTGSLIADIWVPYLIEHAPGDCLWLLEDDPKARLYADRAISLIRSVPEIAAMLEDVDRHDKTKTELKFPQMKVVIAGLNSGNVQSLSWRYVIIDEKWLHAWDGLIRQAMDRTKQYPDTKKILLIGQGGDEDDDPDQIHKGTDQRELHYSCPLCGAYQPFEVSRARPENFPIEKLRGTYAGLSWDTNERTRPNGRWNFEEVHKTAHHRCYYCDGRIEDRPEVRRALNDSYAYWPAGTAEEVKLAAGKVYKEQGILPARVPFPRQVGFHWPGEASMRLPFGDQVVKYLKAKVAAEELAYRLPLQEFYQKDRALAWSESIEVEYKAVVREEYDVKSAWADEAYRFEIVDCQRDLQKFHAGVFAVSLAGESRELYRGTVGSFDDLAEIQKEWKVRDQHVFLDCGYEMTRVLRECVKRGHKGRMKGRKGLFWFCWTGMKGSGRELFLHKRVVNGTVLSEWKIFSETKYYDTNVGTGGRAPRSPWFEFSNLHCKDLLRARRDGDANAPKFLFLADTLPASDRNSHFCQMRSERRFEEWTPRGKQAIWKLVDKTRPNHEWDKCQMLIGVQAKAGIIGSGDSEGPREELGKG